MMERNEDTFEASGKTVCRDCINWSNNDHCAKTKANYCHPDCGDYRQLVKLVKRPETLEEIEADLRNDKRRFSNSTGAVIAQRIEAARKRMEWTHKKELETRDAVIQTEVATREAEREAHEREIDGLKKQVGDAAKLREALLATLDLFWDIQNANRSSQSNQAYAVIRQVKAALAAPPRNCDVGTAEEQIERWQAFCNRYDDDCTGCPCDAADTWNYTNCFAKWAQLPYESGAAK